MAGSSELARAVCDAFARGDLDEVLAAFAEEIEWIEPDGYFAGAGGAQGREAVREVFGQHPEY
jgi:ketosteroid isomerase-like protein